MRPKTVTVTAANSPYIIPLNYRAEHTGVQAEVTGTVDFTVSYTMQNILGMSSPNSQADWIDVTDMTAITADAVKKIDVSISGIRVVVNSGAGSAEITVTQPG